MTGWPLPHTYDSDLGAVRWNRLGGSGPPVVLLHGTPFSSRIWRDVGAALAHRRTHRGPARVLHEPAA
ncbi:MAG TPA: hypothetical protein VGN37_03020 [Actinocatenispora sp.]